MVSPRIQAREDSEESVSSSEMNKVEKSEPLQKDGEDDIKPQVKIYEEK